MLNPFSTNQKASEELYTVNFVAVWRFLCWSTYRFITGVRLTSRLCAGLRQGALGDACQSWLGNFTQGAGNVLCIFQPW